MLISLPKAIHKHGMKIKGVIHVGAHHGQEYNTYRSVGVSDVVFIEPCIPAFEKLLDLFHDMPGVKLFNTACGSENTISTMYIETANQGMSNSLLKPAKHLDQYPSIQFTDTTEVTVWRLDVLPIHVVKYNLLVMDVQGYELEVLKGATETLKHIDYVYCEVNRDEVYEGCAKVWELDEFLQDFTRVETSWAGGTWGDAIYIKTR